MIGMLLALLAANLAALSMLRFQGYGSPAMTLVLALAIAQVSLFAVLLVRSQGYRRAVCGVVLAAMWAGALVMFRTELPDHLPVALGVQLALVIAATQWYQRTSGTLQFSLRSLLGWMFGFVLLLSIAKNGDAAIAVWLAFAAHAIGLAVITIMSLRLIDRRTAAMNTAPTWLIVLGLVLVLDFVCGGGSHWMALRIIEAALTLGGCFALRFGALIDANAQHTATHDGAAAWVPRIVKTHATDGH
jgi:hypothetical protein